MKRGAFSIARVSGDVSPADVASKPLAVEDLRKKVESVGAPKAEVGGHGRLQLASVF